MVPHIIAKGPRCVNVHAQDNGFCRFNRVRIPRTHMAMRHVTLHSDGRYEANAGRRTAPSLGNRWKS